MELSCKTEYALLALLELATHHSSGTPQQIRQIAADQNIPDRYLEQLLATLRRAGIVRSQRGAKGGYLLARDPWKITLWEVVCCIEGLDAQKPSSKAQPKTAESQVIHDVWQASRQAAESVLHQHTLQDLAEKRDARRQVNIMYYI